MRNGLLNILLRSRNVAAFDPLTIAGLAAWYDVSQSAGVSTQTGGIHLLDLSGNARHLISGSSAKRPQLTTSAQNGRNAATFDGVDDFISVAWARSQPFSFFAALKMRANSAGSSVLIGFGDYGVTPEAVVYDNSSARTGIRLYFGAGIGAIDLSDGAFCSLYGVVNAASSLIAKNGTETTGNTGMYAASAITLGDSRDEASVNSAITVGELIVVSAACDATTRSEINTYLRAKWGI